MSRIWSRSLASLAVCAIFGCGGGAEDMPDLGQVSGRVTLGGQPLAKALVEFTPQGLGRPSSGVTDTAGRYQLQYTEDTYGAMIDAHTVMVSLVEPEESYGEEETGAAVELPELPAKALDGSMKFNVEAGDQEINIEL